MAYQVLLALAYLKREKRVHRDIKPSNLLINSEGIVKVKRAPIACLPYLALSRKELCRRSIPDNSSLALPCQMSLRKLYAVGRGTR